MTIIAWDGITLAADKRSISCGHPSTVTKIYRAKNGDLMGVSGTFAVGMALMDWYDQGCTAPYPENKENGDVAATMLVVTMDSKIMLYEGMPHALTIEDSFYAMGSGRDYALAAMHLGYTAQQAVDVANAPGYRLR